MIIAVITINKAELVKLYGYGSISVNDEAANIFTLFKLNMSNIHPKKIWNQMETNWKPVTLFAMEYIHLLDGINRDFMSSNVKDKNCDCVN